LEVLAYLLEDLEGPEGLEIPMKDWIWRRQEGLEAQEERHQHRQKRIETLGRLTDHQTPSSGEWLLRED
jgi:hypothetical protein